MSEMFNALGVNGRDCPVCFRSGTLAGERVDGGKLSCSGCLTVFTLRRRVDGQADTLKREPGHQPLTFAKVCITCGRKHWGAGPDCTSCQNACSHERTWPSGIPGR